MELSWKDILFTFLHFFLNPIEKYEKLLNFHFIIIKVINVYYYKNKMFFVINTILLCAMPFIIDFYNKYKINYKLISTIHENLSIDDVSVFPSGKFIVLTRGSIKIYDINCNLLQTIINILFNNIFVSIKDENNFIVYSNNNNILFYEYIDGNYSLKGNITNNILNLKSAFFFSKR